MDAVVAHIAADGRRTRRLRVSHAFHSPLMEPMLADFATAIEGLSFEPPRMPMISNVTGRRATDEQLCSPGYWVRHVQHPVRFADGVAAMTADGATAFLELGPQAMTTPMIEECLTGSDPAVVAATLRKDRPEPDALLTGLGRLWTHGVPIDWAPVLAAQDHTVELPTYPFQRKRYWLTPRHAETGGDEAEARFWRAVEDSDLDTLAATLGASPNALEPVLPSMASWRRRQREQAGLDTSRYRVVWTPPPRPPTGTPTGTWLIVIPPGFGDDPWVKACADALAVTRTVICEAGFASADADLLRASLGAGDEPVGVVSLLGLDERPHPTCPAVSRGLAGTVCLIQSLGRAEFGAPCGA